jgi:hypothetical protein
MELSTDMTTALSGGIPLSQLITIAYVILAVVVTGLVIPILRRMFRGVHLHS